MMITMLTVATIYCLLTIVTHETVPYMSSQLLTEMANINMV
jgi:hypothetical protein